MNFTNNAGRLAAVLTIASMLAACGGGSHGMVPGGPTGGGTQTPANNTKITAIVPLGSTSSARRPQYLSASGTSSLLVNVTPSDPAEAAQWATLYGFGSLSVCYPIINNGAAVTSNPNVVVTISGSTASVTFPFPSPPGQDAFVVTQVAGTCVNSYTAPTPPPGVPTPAPGSQLSAQQIMSQSPTMYIYVAAGATNNFNTQLSACSTNPNGPYNPTGNPVQCAVPNPNCVTAPCSITPTLGATVGFVYMAKATPPLPITLPAPIPLPIAGPMREQGAFTTAGTPQHVGFPIPIIGLDATGNAIPYTAPVAPATVASSGLFPKGANNPACSGTCTDGVSITHTEVGTGGNHFTLYLVDASTGAIVQNAEPITLTQLNALATQDLKVGGTAGDPYVVVASFDGTGNAASTSMTVKMVATINNTAQTAQTLTITPQSSLFTAVAAGSAPASGYADAAAPYASAADILNTTGATNVAAGGQGYWVTDAGNMHLVGSGTFPVTGATKLTGMTLDNNSTLTAGQILAVDNSTVAVAPAAGNAVQSGGVWVFDPVAHTSKALAIEDLSTGWWEAIGAPQGIAFVPNGYTYVFAGNKVYVIDPIGSATAPGIATNGAFFVAEQIGTLPVTGLNSGTDTGFDVVVSGTKLIFADTGNNRIVSVDTAACLPGGASCTPTVVASGAAFVGLAASGSGYVATDNKGQIYTISSTGTVTSLGLTSGASPKDGVVGVIGGTLPLSPVSYTTQGQTANFFGSASVPSLPYNIAPFTAAGPVFAGAAQTAVAAGTLNFKPDTSNGTFGSTAGNTTAGFGIAAIGTLAAPNTALTANSYLFTDKGALRTLVP